MTPRRRRAARSEQLLRISRRMDSLEGRFAPAPASDHPGAPTPAKDHTGGGGGTQRAPAPVRAPAAAEDGPGGGAGGVRERLGVAADKAAAAQGGEGGPPRPAGAER